MQLILIQMCEGGRVEEQQRGESGILTSRGTCCLREDVRRQQ